MTSGRWWAAVAVGVMLALVPVYAIGRVQARNLDTYWRKPGPEPWRAVTVFLNANFRAGDALVTTPGRLVSFPLHVYPVALAPIHGDDRGLAEAIRTRKYERVWLLASHHTSKEKPWRKVEFDGLMRQLQASYIRNRGLRTHWGMVHLWLFEQASNRRGGR